MKRLPMNALRTLVSGLALAGLVACGGSSSSAPVAPPVPKLATGLDYVNPPASQGYRLVKNTARSTSTKLVLDAVAPAGASLRGLSLALDAGTSTTWVPVATTSPDLASSEILDLGAGPRLQRAAKVGTQLQLALFQKGTAVTLATDKAVAAVALELTAPLAQGQTLPLSVPAGRSKVVTDTGAIQTVTFTLGTLQTR